MFRADSSGKHFLSVLVGKKKEDPTMNSQQHPPVDPEKKEKGLAENERANHIAFDKQQQYGDSDDDADIRETDNPDDVDREGGDLAGTASGGLDDDET